MVLDGDEKTADDAIRDVFKAIFVNDFDGLRKIYEQHSLSTDILDEHGMTPLQHAAYKGNEQIVRWLLDRVNDWKMWPPENRSDPHRLNSNKFLFISINTLLMYSIHSTSIQYKYSIRVFSLHRLMSNRSRLCRSNDSFGVHRVS